MTRYVLKSLTYVSLLLIPLALLTGDDLFLPFIRKAGATAPTEVYIEAGTFQMGCFDKHNAGVACPADELPLHPVYLDAYAIGMYEVTNAEYKQCVANGVCTVPSDTAAYNDPDKNAHPVSYVN